MVEDGGVDMLAGPGGASVLRALFAHVPSAIAIFTADGACVLYNPAYLRLFGSAPPPEYSLRKDELVARLGLLVLLDRALAGETVTTGSFWYDPRQLEHVHVVDANRVGLECTVFPLPARSGRVEHVGITYRDVTAELRACEETAAERDRLRAILEQSGEGIIVADRDGAIELFNGAAQRQHGDRFELFTLDGAPLPLRDTPLLRATRGERVADAVWQVQPTGGERRVLEGTATPLRSKGGGIAGAVLITRDVTARRRTEDELRLHSRVLDRMSEGVSVCDAAGIVRYTNRAEDAMVGGAPGELVGQPSRVVVAVMDRLRESGEWSGEWQGRRKDGTPLTTRARISALKIAGAPCWVCVQEDVTAEVRARAETERLGAELRRSEDHYKATVELNPQLTWTASPDGQIAGRTPPPHPEDRARIDAAWAQAVAGGTPYDVEHRMRAPDGDYRWARSRAFPRRDDAGRIVRWYGTTEDVHDRKVAEDALLDSERYWRELVENLPELAWTALPDGHIDFYNRRWYEYTGTTLASVEGGGWQAVHDPQVLPEVLALWARSIATGEPFEMEFPLRGADGTFRWFLTRVRPLRNVEGRIVRWFGISTNVDEQRKQAAALREAVQARDTFISVASHELNTPLTTLLLRAQALTTAMERTPFAQLEERVRRDVDSLRRQGLRLSSLIGGMLDVSRLGLGQLTLHLEEADLAALTREMVVTFEPEAERSGVGLRLCAPDAIHGLWDPTRVGQIVANLLSNALRYGAGRPVDVELVRDGGDAVLRVSDRGIGIAAAEQQRIFDKFERAVSEQHYGGLGLGLYVTRQLVAEMGGSIGVASDDERGTTFTVRLPVRR